MARRDQRSAEADAYRGWYKLARWRRIRAGQLAKEPLCRMCSVMGRVTAATICDHAEPHRGDPVKFWAGPFQSLCKTHHDGAKQAWERNDTAEIGVDGWPVG